jgi:ribulose-phosphate 3-epimerase
MVDIAIMCDSIERMVKIAPSLLACDFAHLEEEIEDVEHGGADLLHLDIMDGHYVPNITFGPVIVKAIRALTDMPLDTHLMITDPEKYAPRFIESGSDGITFHIEIMEDPVPFIKKIRQWGARPGISLNPETDVTVLESVLPLVDLVLVMSVHPGFGGQEFISESYEKIRFLSRAKKTRGLNFEISVDGGVTTDNAPRLIESGADRLVAGTTIFSSSDRRKTIALLRGNAVQYA